MQNLSRHAGRYRPYTGLARASLIAMLLLPGSATFAAGQETCPDPVALTRGLEPPLSDVRYLADDALGGRMAGSDGERCAADYIVAVFARIGLRPAGENGGWFQDVPLASTLNPHLPGGNGRNVVAMLPGADPALRDEYIVIGAHYDHLGHGGPGSLAPGVEAIHNGADDNASGVAGMLAAARSIAAGPAPRRSVLFVAFTGEELGLLGSSRFVGSDLVPPDDMKAMLNLDMVGRLEGEPLIVYGVGTAEEWEPLLERAAQQYGIELAPRAEGYGPSDHTSFYARDIPVLHFFTNVHGEYHRPEDDWQRVDGDGIGRVAGMVAMVARELADRPAALTLVRGAGTPPAPAGEAQTRGYGAWLGTVPDFSPVEHGVLLSGVTPGSPADQGGIAAGDVIVGIGEHEVADLQAMTDALRAHRPGDRVIVRFLRGGTERRAEVTLGSRASR